MFEAECRFCGTPAGGINGYFDCPCCGKYVIPEDSIFIDAEPGFVEIKHLLSGYIREMNDYSEIPTVSKTNYISLLKHSIVPTTVLQKIDKLIQLVYRQTKALFQTIPIPLQPSVAYCLNQEEFLAVLRAAEELGYLAPHEEAMVIKSPINRHLTIKGLQRAEELRSANPTSKQCFVAMWFDDSMLQGFEGFIAPAIEETGYEAFIIPMKEHNDDITDHIIAEIRRSKFIIADFTGHRGGVYFEAGFAYGLGLPVIWSCREDWFNPVKDSSRRIHFDIDHYNFIVWKDGEDLKEKLRNRIRATII
ncbi:MAG: hypothetical protein CXR30_07640 [Geobacter sp.]|nr:MAG: hypothetical protein CXR30_07640 [Geobacter sp.]